ncbi:SagB family peptide dehydrogenase [Bradyrhizobium sp. ARR65]|uniref:SagB/ThcOx family dehydrogenase n=1 Tax=Bradyrhizobium sp. ARR65 TaxID=1040989 RepID=UPI0004639069|nr:SagB family peptide dehydrogenase [Bradyrhizobium sp. ARR65]
MRAPSKKTGRKTQSATLSARLNERVGLEAQGDGRLAASVDGYPLDLGPFSAGAIKQAAGLRAGLPLGSLAAARKPLDREIAALVRRLARSGLIEYPLSRGKKHLAVIEPQVADYWPQAAKLRASDTVVLSRFAYLRRRGNALVLESPRAAALFQICDPTVASFLARLSKPQKLATLRQQRGFPGPELFALLAACQILLTLDAKDGDGLRPQEGDDNLVLWDFHDLLFHTRSTEGRQANPLGGLYPYAGLIAPLPAERPSWPGNRIELSGFEPPTRAPMPMPKLLRERHSVRDFDEANPITLAELGQFLDATARVLSRWESPVDFDGGGPIVGFTSRPYPSAGSAYELELYLAVANCAGLSRGFYHYDASAHALVTIGAAAAELEAMLGAAQFAMDAATLPQVLITIAARFGRLSWKYSAIAYSLILKDVGAMVQTFYLTATDMGLGGCAIGTGNIELFARTTGLPFHAEGPVGQFALGRGAGTDATD